METSTAEVSRAVEKTSVSAEDVANVLNDGVASIRLKRDGKQDASPEEIRAKAMEINKTLVGQDLANVQAREAYNHDIAEWIASVTSTQT